MLSISLRRSSQAIPSSWQVLRHVVRPLGYSHRTLMHIKPRPSLFSATYSRAFHAERTLDATAVESPPRSRKPKTTNQMATGSFKTEGPMHIFSTPGPFDAIKTFYNDKKSSWEVLVNITGSYPSAGLTMLPRLWLRDHCQCSECVHPATKQRQVDIFKMPSFKIKDCAVDESGLEVTFLSGESGSSGEHRSWFSRDFLFSALSRNNWRLKQYDLSPPQYWTMQDGSSIQNAPPEVEYEKIMTSSEGLAEWTRKIHEYGFCFVNGCPPTPEATEELLSKIGPIRNTHYGAFWDFTSNLASKDTAYTSLGLDVHTDTTYFTEPAGLQLFHMLSHEGTGGETQLVDGFRAANKLRTLSPEYYSALTQTGVHAHASGNEGVSIQPQFALPTITSTNFQGQEFVKQVRWNNYDRATIRVGEGVGFDDTLLWYSAARAFDQILHSGTPDIFYEVQLKPGRPLIFNNWRVLHGRSAFDGRRRMCGGYINMDDFMSSYKTTNIGWEAMIAPGAI